MSSAPGLRGIGFDDAYVAVDETFGDHPLKPAFYMGYLEQDLFSQLTDEADYELKPERRFSSFATQIDLYWRNFKEIYYLGQSQYKAWVSHLWSRFNELIYTAIDAKRGGKNELSEFCQKAHEAVIRD